jgi:hypothetical protein
MLQAALDREYGHHDTSDASRTDVTRNREANQKSEESSLTDTNKARAVHFTGLDTQAGAPAEAGSA